MSLSLHNLQSPKGKANKKRRRIGRGNASGSGTYSGRGLKGQRSRSGGKGGLKIKALRKRLMSVPKLRGFNSLAKKKETVSLNDIEQAFAADAVISPKSLMKHGLIATPRHGVKILGDGQVTKKFIIRRCLVSTSAKAKLIKAGGSVEDKPTKIAGKRGSKKSNKPSLPVGRAGSGSVSKSAAPKKVAPKKTKPTK